MTRPKDKLREKNRPATVVYQRMTPELMLAYRIFGPGLGDSEGLTTLNKQMQSIAGDEYVKEETYVENGKRIRRGVGKLEDIQKQMNVTKAQISQAYDVYKTEIERMIEEESIHLANQASNEASTESVEKRGTKRKSSSSSRGGRHMKRKTSNNPAQATNTQHNASLSPIQGASVQKKLFNKPANDSGGDGAHDEDDEEEEEDENERYIIPTDRWLTKTQALAKLADARRRMDVMREKLDSIHKLYKTQMVPRYEITEIFHSADSYMTRVRKYVQDIYEIVGEHDGEVCRRGEVNVWEDDRTDVTRHVKRLIPMVDEIPLRMTAMERILAEVEWLREKLGNGASDRTRQRFRVKLVEFVKQSHTPVPPHYCVIENEPLEVPEMSSDQGNNKRNKTSAHEIITIDDD